MTTIDNVNMQLQNLPANRPGVNFTTLLTYIPAFNHIHEIFSETKKISGYCVGSLTRNGKQVKTGKWLIVCTNLQLIFMHKCMVADVTHFEIPLKNITAVAPKYGWLANNIKIRDTNAEWELFHVNKTNLRFFEAAVNNALHHN